MTSGNTSFNDGLNKTLNQFNEPANWNEPSKRNFLKWLWLAAPRRENWSDLVWRANSDAVGLKKYIYEYDLYMSTLNVLCLMGLLQYEIKQLLKRVHGDRGKSGNVCKITTFAENGYLLSFL